MNAVHENFNKCSLCGVPSNLKCSSCRQATYCSKEHQKIDWKLHKSKCQPFKVEHNEKLGRHLVATRNVSANNVILKEEPLIIGPKFVDAFSVCLGCLKSVNVFSDFDKCVNCLWPSCSSECSELVTGHHFEECHILSKGRSSLSEFKYEAITPLRCLLLKKKNPRKWAALMAMESHLQYRGLNTDEYREVQKVSDYLLQNFPLNTIYTDISADIIHKVCGILEVNSLEVPFGNISLSAIYESFSLIEHNCLPNVKLSFSSQQLTVKASVNINSGEHVSTMYTNCLWGTRLRQEHLMATKYFQCECVRCTDPTELGTNFSSLKCLLENPAGICPGYILPEYRTLLGDKWKCSSCAFHIKCEEVDYIIQQLSDEVDTITECRDKCSVKKLEDMLEKLSKLLHSNHFHCFTVKHLLVQAYGHQNGFKYGQLSDILLSKKQSYCRELLSILNKLDPGNARLSLYTSVAYYELSSTLLENSKRNRSNQILFDLNVNEAKELLRKAVNILQDELFPSPGFELQQQCKKLLTKIDVSFCE